MKTWNEFKKPEHIKKGYAVMCYTDQFSVEKYPFDHDTEEEWKKNFHKLLDCRIFNEDSELHMMRGDIGKEFTCRTITDDGTNCDYYDDEYFLDIDARRSQKLFQTSGRVLATGGGEYKLPLDSYKDAKIIIRNYVAYDSIGQAYIFDWRLAGFTNRVLKDKKTIKGGGDNGCNI